MIYIDVCSARNFLCSVMSHIFSFSSANFNHMLIFEEGRLKYMRVPGLDGVGLDRRNGDKSDLHKSRL